MTERWERAMSVGRNGVRHRDDGKGEAKCGAGPLTYRIRPEDEIEFRCPQCFEDPKPDRRRLHAIYNALDSPASATALGPLSAVGRGASVVLDRGGC